MPLLNNVRQPELLAPAGTFGIAISALEHGADAVYVGAGRHTLRAQSPGLDSDQLGELLEAARGRSARVYMVLNTMPPDEELGEIRSLLSRFARAGAVPDAVIVSDPGVMAMARELLPGAALHLSTQTGTFNTETLRFWHRQGISRVVLPRELTLEQITRLAQADICELEVFAHGAMCVSISGRCLLGLYLAGRHANRGDCPQPCRLAYEIRPVGEGSERWMKAHEDERGTYLLNARDLNTLPILPRIVQAGVAALKIEGRTKGEHAVATVVHVYREALDACLADPDGYEVRAEWQRELRRLEHRAYTTGFYDGDLTLQAVHSPKSGGAYRQVGIVRLVRTDGTVVVEVKNTFGPGDTLHVLPSRPGRAIFETVLDDIRDLEGTPLRKATANRIVAGRPRDKLHPGDMLRLLRPQ